MSDIQWLLELLQKIFGNEVVKLVLLILSPFAVVFALLWLIKGIIEIVKTTFIPLFYNAEQKRKIRRRQRFADHIESEIRRLNQREDWSDFRFAELEAEVEMEGVRRTFSFIPFIKRLSSGLRREESLSRALRKSQERIILLEGDPGSGKSVALRHIALEIARRAIKSRNPESLIALYINLKELRRENDQPINRQTIENFIIASLKRINDRDVDKFIDDEFQVGIENESWFFLFDSFDEIPEILGAEDADSKIREYAEAISDFMHGLNTCRGVVASRYFKGPGQIGWPRFKILNLTDTRQTELIKRSELTSVAEKVLLGNLEAAKPEIQKFATNPLFLGLLIGYVHSTGMFPQHGDVVFDTYINRRLTQDKERIIQKFGLNIEEIRQVAEEVAFCMAASQDLGLSPTREAIKKSFVEHGFSIHERFNGCLDALEFMKLARSDTSEIVGDQRVFAFSHRRFQEYFPTKLVLARDNITVKELLINPRWRETTVVICQTQPAETVYQIVEGAWFLLDSYWESIKSQLQPIIQSDGKDIPIEFPWPKGCLHLLDLLQNGFANRYDLLPDSIRKSSGVIVSLATLLGSLHHRIWALEVGGIAPTSELLKIIRPAIDDKSHFLSDVAYRQVSRLDEIPDDIKTWIKRSILKKLLQLGIFRGGNAIYAQVSRLVHAREFIYVVRGIQFAYWIDVVSSIIISVMLLVSAFVVPFSDNTWAGVIPLRVPMILFGVSVLIIPLTVYGEADDKSTFQITRLMYGGTMFVLLLPTMLLMKENSLIFMPIFYAMCVLPSVIFALDLIPFEKSLVLVLFSPFFVLLKWMRTFLNGVNSLKTISFSKSSVRALLIAIVVLIIYLLIAFMPIRLWGFEYGGLVFAGIIGLGWLYMIYLVSTKTFLKDRKYTKAWKKWLSKSHEKLNVDEIVAVLSIISTLNAYKFIRMIREKNMLEASQESFYFVNQLVRLVENPLLETEYSESLSLFLEDIKENKLRSMLLDELFLLIEKIKPQLQ